jgi:serine/threonine protein kinase/tetratricopeptide (TPR) repeat protein
MDLGQVVADRFEIAERAGAGGMGVVYRARDRASDITIALKILRSADAARFVREGEVLAKLTHPAIVKYVAAGRLGSGELYLAMEWLEGETLAQRFGRAGLSIEESVTLGLRIAEGLAFAHARGVIHRDIKPSNIFLPGLSLEAAKILDFGIARFRNVHSEITRTGVMIGTPGYMSPEQARGDRQIDPRADVFSLGCVLYKCLTGQNAYRGTDPLAVMAKILVEPPPKPSAAGVSVPDALESLIVRMLAKDPAARPADGGAVQAALEEVERSLGVRSSVPSLKLASLLENEQRLCAVVMAAHVLPTKSIGSDSAVDMKDIGTLRYDTKQPPLELDQGEGTELDSDSAETRVHPDGLHTRLSAAVSTHGGQLEPLAEGSLVATFLASASATDLAARAARCALAMRSVVPDCAMALATGRGTLAERFPLGEVIDRAAAMLRHRPKPKSPADLTPVRVDEVTAGLLDTRFQLSGDRAGLLLCGERDHMEAARTLLGRPTPCVGRERELGVVIGLFDEAVAEPAARVALVTAEAGIGKSRFTHEVVQKLKSRGHTFEVWTGRGDPMSAGSPFAMIAPPLRRAAGILDNEPLVVKQKKLRARVGRHLAGPELPRVTEFLGELLQIPFPDQNSLQLRVARQDSVLMGDQMRRAWEDFVAAECAASPVLFVLEDLHWGDLPSVEFIDAALRALHDRPFVVLALARPEIEEVFPNLWQDRMIHAFRLGPLSKRGCEKLVREMLGAGTPDAVVTRLVERSAGNAFYLEELIRATADGKGESLPETVLAMVQARLEGLRPEARRVLRAGSVFGQAFSQGGVKALLGGAERDDDVLAELTHLQEREIIAPREGRFQGDRGYQFRHALTREAAYAMLTDADKKMSHKSAAEWLANAGEGDGMVLAEHFERGGDPASAVGWYRRAAEQALEGNDLAAAVSRAERGVMLGAQGEVLGALRHLQAEAHNWRGVYAAGERAGTEAMALLPGGTAAWYATVGEIGVAQNRLGQAEGLAALGQLLLGLLPEPRAANLHAIACARIAARLIAAGQRTLAEKLLYVIDPIIAIAGDADPLVTAWEHRARASFVAFLGDAGAHIEHLKRSLEAFDKIGDLRRACAQRMNLGHGYLLVGAYNEAESALREALATAQRMGLLNLAAVARHNLGLARAYQGALDEARALEAEAMKDFVAQGDRRQETISQVYLATIRLFEGDLDGAEQAAREAVRSASSPTAQCFALATLARAYLARISRAPMGQRSANETDVREALIAAHDAKAMLDATGGVEEGEALVHVVYAEALAHAGDPEAARAAIQAAAERLRARASWLTDPAMRESFLTLVPENARTMELSRMWLGS